MQWTSFRLGLFIVGTLAILAIGVFLIGSRDLLFTSTYELRANFKNVAGLNNGADVRVGGIHKGTVKRIELPTGPTGGMTVVMSLERSTKHVIKQDSLAAIQTEGLMGNKYVEISFGSPGSAAVDSGSTIGSVPPLDISDLVRKTGELLETSKRIVANMEESSDHLKQISTKIDQGQGTLGKLVNDKTAYRELAAATAAAKAGATAFKENMAALKRNFFLRGFFRSRGYEDSTKLLAHAVPELPRDPYARRFAYDAKTLFDGRDTAKLAREGMLNDAGRFLESTPFRLAVAVARAGMIGDSEDARTLTEARAMVVRDYLVNHFRLDDTRVKTLGLGKTEEGGAGEGMVEILVYPPRITGTTGRIPPPRTMRSPR